MMVKASKSAGSNSNANRSQASNINKQTTPMNKKKEYSRYSTETLEMLQVPIIMVEDKQLYTLNKNGIFLPHLGFLEQWRMVRIGPGWKEHAPSSRATTALHLTVIMQRRRRGPGLPDLRTPCKRSKRLCLSLKYSSS